MRILERDQTLMAAQNSRGGKISKASYRPGLLIRAAMHEPDLNQGGPVSSNVNCRRQIQKRYEVWTHPYKGTQSLYHRAVPEPLSCRPSLYPQRQRLLKKLIPDEFVSVCDHRNKGEFHKHSKHTALVTEHLNAGFHSLHEISTAHITYSIAGKYDLSVVHEGHLETASTKHLVQVSNEYAPRAAKH